MQNSMVAAIVLVIGCWKLGFIYNLVLVIWDLELHG